jgi:hypothetical protein
MSTAFVASADRLSIVASDDDWTVTERLRDRRLESVAVSPHRPDRVLAGTFESGLFRSTDGGETFDRVDFEGPDAVTSLAISPRDPDVVWAGTEPSAVFRSTDGGTTFEPTPDLAQLPSADDWYFPPRPDTHHVRWIEPHPADSDRWYVAIEAGALVRTFDGGDSWEDRPADARRDNHTLATHPDRPDRVYTAAGDGYAESDDGGDTWRYPQAGLDHRYVWGLAVDPGDPGRVLVSAARGATAAHRRGNAHVYRKEDDGGAWERLDGRGLPTGDGTYRAVLDATGDGRFWACNDRGVFRSTDGGDSWTGIDASWPERFGSRPPRGFAVIE